MTRKVTEALTRKDHLKNIYYADFITLINLSKLITDGDARYFSQMLDAAGRLRRLQEDLLKDNLATYEEMAGWRGAILANRKAGLIIRAPEVFSDALARLTKLANEGVLCFAADDSADRPNVEAVYERADVEHRDSIAARLDEDDIDGAVEELNYVQFGCYGAREHPVRKGTIFVKRRADNIEA